MEGGSGLPGGMLSRTVGPGVAGIEMPDAAAYGYPAGGGRGKQQQSQGTAEDASAGEYPDAGAANAAKRVSQPQSPSPWHRMKWTDHMVRLLVWVVHSVGEEVAAGCGETAEASGKARKAAEGMQQRKGKWKSVSRAMMEKGFFVSPQQCEDKFNDLNKRYKRLTELLGKGTACRAVENPAILDSMDHLPTKAKDEARKLLCSKHLFFREMCAYHNISAAGVSTTAAAASSSCTAPFPPDNHHGGGAALSTVEELVQEEASGAVRNHYQEEGEEGDDDDEVSSGDDFSDDRKDVKSLETFPASRQKRKAPLSPPAISPLSLSLSSPSWSTSAPAQQLREEFVGLQGDPQQKIQWLRMKAAEQEERQVSYHHRWLQLERRRFKWLRFSGSKEREMEKTRLRNERLRLENERMLLLLQHKEIRLLELSSNGAGDSSLQIMPENLHHHHL
ncbi:hypothetical protein AXF42_Ash002237 [Apostasia shenzhenica]|uniref:Myb/SANT-like DNA-binding domain-containing protein n=1 Tax=Apostasia shenzhenica TaxID=1088818 RepID=A0A2I0AN30_9ASPA|nr:hypothetical protein AXF42_Ash002237 [Apostasia shenzhenica]